jgi:hypothetical protein
MLKQVYLLVAFLFLVGVSFATEPIGTTQFGNITYYNTGWNTNQVLVKNNAPFVNLSNCPSTDGYVTDLNNASVQQSALLGALLSGKQVAFALQGCTQGRPMIIGVNVWP